MEIFQNSIARGEPSAGSGNQERITGSALWLFIQMGLFAAHGIDPDAANKNFIQPAFDEQMRFDRFWIGLTMVDHHLQGMPFFCFCNQKINLAAEHDAAECMVALVRQVAAIFQHLAPDHRVFHEEVYFLALSGAVKVETAV